MARTHVDLLGLALGLVAGCTTAGPLAFDASAPGPDAAADARLPIVDASPPPPFTQGVSTLAGAAEAGSVDGDRAVARFANPVNVAYGPDGDLYVADFDNGAIRAVDPTGRVRTVFARPGFERPFGLAFAPDRALYVSTDNDDTGAHDLVSGTVWRIDTAARTATVVARRIGRPRGLTVLAGGTLVLADNLHQVVESLDPATGAVAILAGAWDQPGQVDAVGAAARFSAPYGIVDRGDGSVAIADYGNSVLRSVTLATGAVATVAAIEAPPVPLGVVAAPVFAHPQGLAIDAAGALYVTDTGGFRVRRVADGLVETIAGDGSAGYLDADDRLAAEFYGLEGVSVTPDGALVFVADGSRGEPLPYNRVREIRMVP
jgi:sugar lactone lactonase YvrE